MKDPLQKIATEDGRYSPEAFRFLFEALESSVRSLGREEEEGVMRHVTGQELLGGLREMATQAFGPLAAQVWRSWGIQEGMDWGRIVFLLVDASLLKRREEDTLEDFGECFDFDKAFVEDYSLALPTEIGPGPGPVE